MRTDTSSSFASLGAADVNATSRPKKRGHSSIADAAGQRGVDVDSVTLRPAAEGEAPGSASFLGEQSLSRAVLEPFFWETQPRDIQSPESKIATLEAENKQLQLANMAYKSDVMAKDLKILQQLNEHQSLQYRYQKSSETNKKLEEANAKLAERIKALSDYCRQMQIAENAQVARCAAYADTGEYDMPALDKVWPI